MRSPGSPTSRFTKSPPAPHRSCAARRGVEDDDVAAVRGAEVVAEAAGEHAVGEARRAAGAPGRAQCSVGSIDDDGIRYGFTTHALIASTIATAPTIVTIQSIATRHGRGSPRVEPVDRVPHPALLDPALLAPPLLDPRVVARQEHVRHPPAAELGGPRVVRVLEPAVELGARSSRLARTPRCRARPGSRRAIASTQHHRRQLAAGEDVRADRDRVRGEVLDDPLVEALEPRREQRQRAPRPRAPRRPPASSCRPCGVSAITRCSGAPP